MAKDGETPLQLVVHRTHGDPASPVSSLAHDLEDQASPPAGLGLCLSGGGYRAMLFHVGCLWRLNELGYLPRLSRVSSVSGGSIAAGRLGLVWSKLDFDTTTGVGRAFEAQVARPLRELAGHTIDLTSIVLGAALPKITAADLIERAYKKYLFGDATVADLPSRPDTPCFVINAASVQTGALFRFTQAYVADWRIGLNRHAPRAIPLARAVAASAAFPPLLSPVVLELDAGDFESSAGADLPREPLRRRAVLTDGGNYDNLGLETAYKRCQTILVSDAVGGIPVDDTPHGDWIRHGIRAIELLLNQSVSVRKRQLIAAFKAKQRSGAYWSIRSELTNYGVADALPFDRALAGKLAALPTRLEALGEEDANGLINWGYVIADAALRTHVEPGAPRPTKAPC
ncbi:MAG: patatin-like phospholipase family protein [Deltaproteobacteria bacterium]|nr:patatin-like phospholipase family protein [Deltaproteobacteria bacterium]